LRAWEGTFNRRTVAGGGYFDGKRFIVDYRISFTDEDYLEPDYFIIEFERPGVDLSYQIEDPRFPAYRVDNSVDLNDPGEFVFDEVMSQVWHTTDTDFISAINVKIPHTIGSAPGFFKLGAKLRHRVAVQSSDTRIYDQFNGTFLLGDVLGDYRNPNHLEGRYDLGPFPDLHLSRAFLRDHLDSFVLNERETREDSDPNSYRAAENIFAAYGSASFQFGRLRTLFGARVEETGVTYTGNEVVIADNGLYERTNALNGLSGYTRLFPG